MLMMMLMLMPMSMLLIPPSRVQVFNETFHDTHFSVIGSDNQEYEICKHGRDITLNWANRAEYCRLLIEYRKNEFTVQCDAIRRGLATVVPYTLLSLFTWDELQMQGRNMTDAIVARWAFVVLVQMGWDRI